MPPIDEPWDPGFAASPALVPYADLVGRFAGAPDWPPLAAYDALVEERRRACAPSVAPIRFVTQEPKRGRRRPPLDIGSLYDARITVSGEVPTRPANHHDFYNAIAWAAWPRTKRAIHARQYEALRRWIPAGAAKLPGARTREQDALTIFDEGGVVLVVPRAGEARFREALSEDDAAALARLAAEGALRAMVFGHAVLEHARRGVANVHALGLVAVVDGMDRDFRARADLALEARIRDAVTLREPRGDALVEVAADGLVTAVRRP